MSQLVSLLIIIFCLSWSWGVVFKAPTLAFETHSAIQNQLSAAIPNALAARDPSLEKMTVINIWTETIDANSVRAHFRYKFEKTMTESNKTESQLMGNCILTKAADSEMWTVSEVKISDETLVFQDGLVVDPSQDIPQNDIQHQDEN
jgi:hypothetical protein